jgi:8-oxo-dGTP pyrophosphatase MutT (NUDIX family)
MGMCHGHVRNGRRARACRLDSPGTGRTRRHASSGSVKDMAQAGQVSKASRWTIHGERVVDDSRRGRLSIAEVELPDGVRFEQYVLRLPKSATVAVVREDQVLMLWRHRFVIDRWVWELPGGYVDDQEDPAITAAREVEEETGWRPGPLEQLAAFQPMVSTIDSENLVFMARGAEHVGDAVRDINEAERVAWIPLRDVPGKIQQGEIVGSSSMVALFAVLHRRGQ